MQQRPRQARDAAEIPRRQLATKKIGEQRAVARQCGRTPIAGDVCGGERRRFHGRWGRWWYPSRRAREAYFADFAVGAGAESGACVCSVGAIVCSTIDFTSESLIAFF